MKTSKVKLDYMPNVNFQIVGISTSEIDYKLAFGLVRGFGMDFYLLPCIEVEREQQQTMSLFDNVAQQEPNTYSVYGNAIDSFRKSDLLLISNRHNGICLIDEFHNFDYLFIVRDYSSFGLDRAMTALRSMDCITGAYLLPFENIKSKKSIYDLWDSLQNRQ
ncbi:MAG: IPExxxVDY family protein [Bacteroidales bacterium]|nr:IPExxxVDY family protein [Bacteroidales bacterium]MBQ2351814.1 IPExxxVDY family protein [Bacteroidales bacterium]MBQ2575152.1 IPExxxVDY family protein [Bacteroidales bacterium]MBQ3989347.1 IPExxxVDY family protein [Bacteroidales bacterium]MBR3797322.1 IPExxxVDY family protein [Bacteroidales bacterium]